MLIARLSCGKGETSGKASSTMSFNQGCFAKRYAQWTRPGKTISIQRFPRANLPQDCESGPAADGPTRTANLVAGAGRAAGPSSRNRKTFSPHPIRSNQKPRQRAKQIQRSPPIIRLRKWSFQSFEWPMWKMLGEGGGRSFPSRNCSREWTWKLQAFCWPPRAGDAWL